MRWPLRSLLLWLLAPVLCLSGLGQYQDRDSRGLPKTSQHAPPPALRVDINHASLEELFKVPGMTPSWAGRIVRFRPYHAKTDLLENGVVTAEIYNRIKDFVIAHRDKK
jgi:DNA uptake protein ComE-like DNA-binding protein